jgi:BirA family biotin operon repressor/biotin-[acetyl-CoA-carboxylase] ligase
MHKYFSVPERHKADIESLWLLQTGVKLLQMADELETRLLDLPVQVRRYASVASTNDSALDWAMHGAPHYGLVFADHQSAGRGRHQRNWITKPGVALAFSLVIHPTPAEAAHASLFSPLAAMAMCDALQKYPVFRKPGACRIKWPNDVLLNGRKASGILVESTWLGDRMHSAVIGMGVNVKPESVPVDANLLFPATSVETEGGISVDRYDLLHDIIQKIISLRAILLDTEFIRQYEHLLAYKGQKVTIKDDTRDQVSGIVTGILPNGDLLLEDENGQTIPVNVGDVHLRPF